jgi:hypothetical protein
LSIKQLKSAENAQEKIHSSLAQHSLSMYTISMEVSRGSVFAFKKFWLSVLRGKLFSLEMCNYRLKKSCLSTLKV